MDDLAPLIAFGASPRATHLPGPGRARRHAFIDGRGYVTPEDVKAVAPDVLRHRLDHHLRSRGRGPDADDIVERVLQGVAVP